MTKQDELITFVFDGQPNLLSDMLVEWMEASPRFTDFVETYRYKIRKKIRSTREPESMIDLCGELEVAYCLLSDRRLDVAYEPYASTKKRSPDFAVTYRASLSFNIEVARIRVDENIIDGIDLARKEERLLRILLDKLEQLQPGMANLLVIQTREDLAHSINLNSFMQEVKTKAESRDPSFYAHSHYANPAAFYKDFRRLSGILIWTAGGQPWSNKQAQQDLDGKIFRLLGSLPSSNHREFHN